MVKATAAAKKAEPVRGPPRKELLQNRWEIENWVACEEAVSLKEEEVKRSHAVYISHCSDCVIQVRRPCSASTAFPPRISCCVRTVHQCDSVRASCACFAEADVALQSRCPWQPPPAAGGWYLLAGPPVHRTAASLHRDGAHGAKRQRYALQVGPSSGDEPVPTAEAGTCCGMYDAGWPVQVLGKVNTVMLDKCRKVGLVFGSVVSTVELVNCSSCKVQCNTACPTLNVDKTDGVQVRHRPARSPTILARLHGRCCDASCHSPRCRVRQHISWAVCSRG